MRERRVSEGVERRSGWSDSMAIGTSVADTTSNGGRALDFPTAPIAAGNSRLIETVCACVCVRVSV